MTGVFADAADLGDGLERLVDLLADADNDAAAVLIERGLHVDLVAHPRFPRANVIFYVLGDSPGRRSGCAHRKVGLRPADYAWPSSKTRSRLELPGERGPDTIVHTATLFGSLFVVLAELWTILGGIARARLLVRL